MIGDAARHVRDALELLKVSPDASHAIAHLEAAAANLKPLAVREQRLQWLRRHWEHLQVGRHFDDALREVSVELQCTRNGRGPGEAR